MSIRTLTQEDPIGLAGGLNLYGFAGGDPINFWDPFGLCRDENGDVRQCELVWDKDADSDVDGRTLDALQRIAQHANADLYLSSGVRDDGSTHTGGLAVDISAIRDDGQGEWVAIGYKEGGVGVMRPESKHLVGRVSVAAQRTHNVVQDVYAPNYLWSNKRRFYNASIQNDHMNHIHIRLY